MLVVQRQKEYVRPRNTRTEMYAGHVACCLLVSYVEYAPRVLLRLGGKDGTDRWTKDGHQTVTLRFPLDGVSVKMYWNSVTSA